MDSVDELIELIKKDRDVKTTYFSGALLNNVGEMCVRYGYGTVRLFLIGRKKDENQTRVLLKILGLIEERKLPKEIGTLVFKKLNVIKSFKEDR